MVTTRSKPNAESHDGTLQDAAQAPSQQQQPNPRTSTNTSRKRKSSPTSNTSTPPTAPPTKKPRQRQDSSASEATTPLHHHASRLPVPTSTPTISPLLATKVRTLLCTHGFAHPLQFSPLLPEPDGPDNHTIVAALAWAIFRSPSTSPRMTPAVAGKTIELFIAANGTSVGALRDSSPQLRNDILAAGGCGGKSAARRRYREDTAEALHALAVVLEERYDGVAYALLPETAEGDSHWYRRGWMEASRAEIEARQRACGAEMRERLAGFEGIGERGADAFVGLMQGVWPALAPYLEPGSARTARELGLAGGDAWTLFECVGRREWDMARLNAALARVREKGEVGAFRERFASRRFDQTVDPKGPPVTTYGFDGWSWWVAE